MLEEQGKDNEGRSLTTVNKLAEEEPEDGAFPEPYYKQRPVDSIRRDFYAMMTVSNMPARRRMEAERKAGDGRSGKALKYEYHHNHKSNC
ncbi:MAG: hypothetical protein LBB48_06300 [Treponema sp.]|nr:hypothetical protein [Treponema sp.]